MVTYAPIVNKISEVFLNIELGVQEGFIKGVSYVSILLPSNASRKFKPSDEDSVIERIEWFIRNFKPTTNGIVLSIYYSKSLERFLDAHWNLNNLWISKETWEGKGNYVTVQFPEKKGDFWNSYKFYENWEVIKEYLDSKNIEIKEVSYETSLEETYRLLLNTKLHISYIGSSYFIASLARVPTIGLGKESSPDFTNGIIRKNCWGTGCMSINRVLQIDKRIYNGIVKGSIDSTDTYYIKDLVMRVIEYNSYSEFWNIAESNKNIKMMSHPWVYGYIDNYLPEKDFIHLRNQAMSLDLDKEKVVRKIFDYDPTPDIELIFDNFRFHRKTPIRTYSNLKKFIHFAITPENFVHKMHIEAPFKIMSAVLYLGPEENRGTRLYETPEDEPIEIEWKPNRLFVFCGHDHTFHDYLSTSVRYTYNWFLVDEPVIENQEYKENLVEVKYIK
jgi:hypothetical protein